MSIEGSCPAGGIDDDDDDDIGHALADDDDNDDDDVMGRRASRTNWQSLTKKKRLGGEIFTTPRQPRRERQKDRG